LNGMTRRRRFPPSIILEIPSQLQNRKQCGLAKCQGKDRASRPPAPPRNARVTPCTRSLLAWQAAEHGGLSVARKQAWHPPPPVRPKPREPRARGLQLPACVGQRLLPFRRQPCLGAACIDALSLHRGQARRGVLLGTQPARFGCWLQPSAWCCCAAGGGCRRQGCWGRHTSHNRH